MQLHGNAQILPDGQLAIGGLGVKDLAQRFATPLFIYDQGLIESQCRRFHHSLAKHAIPYHLSYASKAFLCKALVHLLKEEGLGLDVVSLGELLNAVEAGMDPSQIHFHGNNKLDQELEEALKLGVGVIVIDSLDEIQRLKELTQKSSQVQKVMIRVTPGVSAHTHEFIQTGAEDSKFGLSLALGLADQAIEAIASAPYLDLVGVHFHIGSQIFGTQGTLLALDKVMTWLKQVQTQKGLTLPALNIGGGFGIRYTEEDVSYPIEAALDEIVTHFKALADRLDYPLPELWLEPGRSIIGEAGWTLYQVGTIKEIPGHRTYVSIDGGMTDHIRTALYQAKYEVALANKMDQPAQELVTVAGKCCESGDLIAKDVQIAHPEIGDLLIVSCTGAYHYSMASNYNLLPKPPVVFVKDGQARLVIQRESYASLWANQL